MTRTTFLIEPLDTWFFREARPFDVAGGNELASVFPPPARTVASALHNVLNAPAQGRWAGPSAPARVKLDEVRCRGPYLVRRAGEGWERLYPVPLNLLQSASAQAGYVRLAIPKEPVCCDLGRVLLPALDERGAKPLENAWLTAAQLQHVLQGGLPGGKAIKAESLYAEEHRVGLGRDNQRRAYKEGQLFSTRHIRLRDGVALACEWEGETDWQGGNVHFGGEGRMAHIRPQATLAGVEPPRLQGGERGLILLLTTPAQFRPARLPVVADGSTNRHEPTTLPPGLDKFTPEGGNGQTVWRGGLRYRKPEFGISKAGGGRLPFRVRFCFYKQINDRTGGVHGQLDRTFLPN